KAALVKADTSGGDSGDDDTDTDSDNDDDDDDTVLGGGGSNPVNTAPLQVEVDKAPTIEEKESEYTPESYENYKDALEKAQAVLDDPNATQEEIDAALAELQAATAALVLVDSAYIVSPKTYDGTIQDYDADKWATLDTAAALLEVKVGLFDDSSTVFDFDVILVNRINETLDALYDIKNMPLADTADGQALMELCDAAYAERSIYTEASIAALVEAMDAYDAAEALLDITDEVNDTIEVLKYWLTGVSTNGEDPYAGYFDFDNTQTKNGGYDNTLSYLTDGWTSVGTIDGYPYLTLYSEDTGYGVTEAVAGRNRGNSDTILTDFMMGGTFKVDLPAGVYNVTVYSGDLSGSGSSCYQFYINYGEENETQVENLDYEKASSGSCLERTVSFELTEAATLTVCTVNSSGTTYTNGIIIEQYIAATVEVADTSLLVALIEQIEAEMDAGTLV
ncbi:MAG: FIVAR domain-containing protein, partial [Lachnospiraceae bacterium]|nr:FIVAR domain-containing protein [Lachnospiraceae bacterium]